MSALAKQSSVRGSSKFRDKSNSFWEGTRREKTRLTYLLSQNMYFYMWLYGAFYKFLEVQNMHLQVKRGVEYRLYSS